MPSFRDFGGAKFQAAKDFKKKTLKGKIIECGPKTIKTKGKREEEVLAIKLNNHQKLFRVNVACGESLAAKWGDDYEKWVNKYVEISLIDTELEGEKVKGFAMKPIGK